MLTGNEPVSTEPPGDDGSYTAYTLSFANEQRFLLRQGVALALLVVAGIIEIAPTPHKIGVWESTAAVPALAALGIMVTALRRFRATEKAIYAQYWSEESTG
jgi:hypothetical protein